MKTMKDAAKDIVLAGLGTIDEQNEDIKDLLRRGSAVFGMGEVENEELMYNGNRERILAERAKKHEGENTYSLGHGRSITFDSVKDEEGNVVERTIEFAKDSEEKAVERTIEFSVDSGEKDAEQSIESAKESDQGKKDA